MGCDLDAKLPHSARFRQPLANLLRFALEYRPPHRDHAVLRNDVDAAGVREHVSELRADPFCEDIVFDLPFTAGSPELRDSALCAVSQITNALIHKAPRVAQPTIHLVADPRASCPALLRIKYVGQACSEAHCTDKSEEVSDSFAKAGPSLEHGIFSFGGWMRARAGRELLNCNSAVNIFSSW